VAAAPTAERLMRSRYSAFAVGDADYLLRSWHPDRRPARVELDGGDRWLGLEITSRERGGMFDTEGTVGFRARVRRGGQVHEIVELSRFVSEDGAWVYVAAV
jgi:SEC-C motif-containing protein